MAKDKEKLFRGVDDKAITFQRAVFIVCNLKRLIKRPKKDGDKHVNFGGGNSSYRKRSGESSFYGSSGANQNDDDELDEHQKLDGSTLIGRFGPAGRGSHRRSSRIRDPIRRAFTLPTMLCQSFVGVAPGGGAGGAGRQADDETSDGQDDYQQDNDNPNSNQPSTTPTGSVQASTSRQVSPVSCNNWPRQLCSSCNSPTSLGSQPNHCNHHHHHHHHNRSNNNNSSISCLATPVRKSTAGAAVGAPGGSNETAGELLQATTRTDARQHLAERRPLPGNVFLSVMSQVEASAGQRQDTSSWSSPTTSKLGHLLKQPQNQRQLWCPIWALAMDILDARQCQPREQQAQAQQAVGAPSPAPFLVGPRCERDTLKCHNNRDPVEGPDGRHQKEHNNGLGANQDEDDDDVDDVDGEDLIADKDDDDHDEHNQDDLSGQSDQEKSTTSPHSTKTTSGKRNVKRHQKRASELESFEKIPMKRFSSALCLNNNELAVSKPPPPPPAGCLVQVSKVPAADEQQQGSRGDHQAVDEHDGVPNNSKTKRANQSKQVAAKSKTSRQNLLNPTDADPTIALARHRRPSVTNLESSVNVDQQGLFAAVECNQLERARTILDDGKVNVNSLNGDKLTCLDVAVLMRNVDMVRLLQHYKAKESSALLSAEGRENQLYSLYLEARRLVEDLANSLEAIQVPPATTCSTTLAGNNNNLNTNTNSPITSQQQQQQQTSSSKELQHQTGNLAGSLSTANTTGGPSSTSASTATGNASTNNSITPQQPQHQQLMLATGSLLSSALLEEKQRQLQYWRRRLDLFMHMRYEFERLEVPNAPELAVLQVVGESSLGIKIIHSNRGCRRPSLAAVAPAAPNEDPQNNQTRPQLDQLARAADANRLRCGQGPRCSHWRLDEFQSRPPQVSVAGAVAELSQASNGAKEEQMKKQQRLAVFNHLLAQQLSLLSQQQQPPPEEPSLAGTSRPSGHTRPQSLRFYASTHSESTDTACDHFRSSSNNNSNCNNNCNHYDHTNLAAGFDQRLNSDHQSSLATAQIACHSLAYQLMTTKRQVALPFRPIQQQQHQQADHSQDGGVYVAAATKANKQQVVIITKYKVEWSLSEQMDSILGSLIIYNTNLYPLECKIEGLINGQTYYVRVSAGNHKGFSESIRTTPVCLAPSSWRQVAGNKASRRRSKYDEQVFKKFTKLILLNKHILVASDTYGSTSNGQQVTSPSAQSKSTLINMLLLDATMPTTSEQLRQQARLNAQLDRVGGEPVGEVDLLCSPIKSIGSTATTKEQQQQQQQQQTSQLRVRKNLKNFFQSNSAKFHKLNNQNKRGLYLATVIYHSQARLASANYDATDNSSSASGGKKQTKRPTKQTDEACNKTTSNSKTQASNAAKSSSGIHQIDPNSDRIVVSNDDRLPIIEIMNDLVSPSTLMGDFYWLLKINGTRWIDIKRLRQELQKSHSSSTLHLRIKLLQAIEQMQLALNLEDLGRLFYRPIQAHDGSIIICTCRHVDSLKSVSNLSIKWSQFGKIIPRHLRKISEAIQVTSQQQSQLLLSSSSFSRDQQQRNPSWSSSSSRKSSSLAQDQTAPNQTGAETPSSGDQTEVAQWTPNISSNQRQPPPTPTRNGLETGGLRLCDNCQQNLGGRGGCMMASGSSSSSINSTESQWSSQSGSTTTTGRNCTCSRSNSTSMQVPSAAADPKHQQQSLAISSHANWTSSALASQQPMNQMQVAASAPASKRSSSASARSGSIMSGFGGPASSTGQSGFVHGGSFSVHHNHYDSHQLSGSADVGSGRFGSHSQSQQLMAAPQKSSTYLMLASLSLYDLLLYNLREIIHFDQASVLPLNRGLYLGFVQLQTTVESMRLLVPRARPNMIPNARIRDNAHVSREEWQLLRRFASGQQAQPQCGSSATSAAGRSSDPSIWSLATSKPEQQQSHRQQARKSGQSGSNLSVGDRDRAKSVSPGLMKDSKMELHRRQAIREAARETRTTLTTATTNRPDGLSISSDQIVSSGAQMEAKSTNNTAHSDTDLTSTMSGANQATGRALQASNPTVRGPQRQEDDDEQTDNKGDPEQGNKDSEQSRQLSVSKQLTCSMASLVQTPEETFVRLVGSAAKRLLNELRCQLPRVYDEHWDSYVSILNSLNDEQLNRIYHLELIELAPEVTFILLIPAPENVCPVTSHERSNILADNRDYMLLPLQIFETIHISTYEPDLLGKYSRLSAILETDLIVAQHEHRQAFSSNELKSTKSRVNQLQDMVGIADEFWRQLRWIVDVVSFARDKLQANNGIRLGSIWSYFELSPSSTMDSQLGGGGSLRLSNQPVASSRQASNEAKRTSSVQVPQIQLTRTPSPPSVVSVVLNEQPSPSDGERQTSAVQQQQRQTNGRRHSDEGAPAHFRRDSIQNPQVVVDRVAPGDQSLVDQSQGSIFQVELNFDEDNDDDQAIYAYHISLRDATKAAAQRKSSQQSVAVCIDKQENQTMLEEVQVSSVEPQVSVAREDSHKQQQQHPVDQTGTTTSRQASSRHLKSTNPFLSDSFEQT